MYFFRGDRDYCDRYPLEICPLYHRYLPLCVYQLSADGSWGVFLSMYESGFIFYVNMIAHDRCLQRLC
jgi:hypothetical protein